MGLKSQGDCQESGLVIDCLCPGLRSPGADRQLLWLDTMPLSFMLPNPRTLRFVPGICRSTLIIHVSANSERGTMFRYFPQILWNCRPILCRRRNATRHQTVGERRLADLFRLVHKMIDE